MECYNLRKNEWMFVSPMIDPHYGHAGTVHGDLMYVSGKFLRPLTVRIQTHQTVKTYKVKA